VNFNLMKEVGIDQKLVILAMLVSDERKTVWILIKGFLLSMEGCCVRYVVCGRQKT